MANQQLLTIREACNELFSQGYNKTTRQRLRRWVQAGQFQKVLWDGNRCYIPRSEILKLGGSNDTEKTVE